MSSLQLIYYQGNVSKLCHSSKRILKRINKTGKKKKEITGLMRAAISRETVISYRRTVIKYKKEQPWFSLMPGIGDTAE